MLRAARAGDLVAETDSCVKTVKPLDFLWTETPTGSGEDTIRPEEAHARFAAGVDAQRNWSSQDASCKLESAAHFSDTGFLQTAWSHITNHVCGYFHIAPPDLGPGVSNTFGPREAHTDGRGTGGARSGVVCGVG